jgi:hypothetical protein
MNATIQFLLLDAHKFAGTIVPPQLHRPVIDCVSATQNFCARVSRILVGAHLSQVELRARLIITSENMSLRTAPALRLRLIRSSIVCPFEWARRRCESECWRPWPQLAARVRLHHELALWLLLFALRL